MMRIRPDQVETLIAASRAERRVELIDHIRDEHPEVAAEARELADRVIEDADELDVEPAQWPRLVPLATLSDAEVATPAGSMIFATLANPQRSASERLDFIERHLLPRIAAQGAA